jgi:Mg-chelatase subunit ChlD
LRALARRVAESNTVGLLPWQTEDLRVKLRQRPRRSLIVFVLDASDSMGVHERMAAAKGAVLALLTSAYQRRDRVALVVFRDASAELLLPPTGAVAIDTLPRRSGAAPMRRIAEQLGARYHHVNHLRPSAIVRALKET